MNHNLLLLLFFFFFFVLLFNAAFSDYLSPDSCKPQTCGGLQNITYPFWVEQSQPSYCGVPDFKLSCTDDKAVLNVSGDAYYVQKIFYNNRSVLLSNTQFFNGSDCAPRHNLTFSPPFRLNPSNTYIHLFEGCGSSLTGSLGLTPICSGVIAVPYDYHGSFNYTKLVGECKYSVVAPVWSLDNEEGIHDYLQILKDGFLLNWNTSTCIDECLQRGGRCGYDTATNNAVCLCEDRVHFKKCKARSVSSGTSLVRKIIIGISTITAIMLTLVILIIFKRRGYNIFFRKTSKNGNVNVEKFIQDYRSMLPTQFSYIDVKKMTNGFRDKLGQGGYGSVYKGKLPNGQFIAAKILEKSKDNGQDFINEVATIGRMHHFNIIRLLGFCCEGLRRALVYEYMSNGSLGDLISNKEVRCSLGQEKLLEIAIGIANGIQYMHNGCDTRILHLDIKPQNILLDHNYHPKISDFGLAKLYSRKDSVVSLTGARGTVGYIAPEVFMRTVGGVSHKSDVYSYGMLLLDMIVRRENVELENDHSSSLYFPNWIYIQLDQWREMELDGLVIEEVELHVARKMVLVGLWCVQINPSDRPSISRVLEMLEGSHESIEIPPMPFFPSSPRQHSEVHTSSADNIDALPPTNESM